MTTLEAVLEVARERRRPVLPPPVARRVLRERAGLRQREVAEVLGASVAMISAWESGRREPGPKFLAAYAGLLARLAREVSEMV